MTTMTDKVRLLQESGLFDERWYVARYPDVLRCAMSPAEHFVRIGVLLGRKPSEERDSPAAAAFLAGCRTVSGKNQGITEEQREAVSASRFFDAAWYRAHYGFDLANGVDPLEDYLQRSASDPRIDPGPLFSTANYAQTHNDSANTAPLVHACWMGLPEGRPILDPVKVNGFLTIKKEMPCSTLHDFLDRQQPIHILNFEGGNFFFEEIALYLQAYLREAGYTAQCAHHLPRPFNNTDSIIVVAPHEFCVLGSGKTWDETLLERAVYLNTEQWHTGWFSHTYRYLVKSNKAIDINPASAAGLQSIGINTAFLPILPRAGTPFSIGNVALSHDFASHRDIRDLTYPNDPAERPYDVLFVGAANARREAEIARLAPVLADYESFLHCPRFTGPVRPGDPDMMATSDLLQIARNVKILLNIHQGESQYFEWHRLFVFGIMQGCVVLTEPCIANDYVEAGTHYLECELDDMPDRLRWLLDTSEGQEELRRVYGNCARFRLNDHDLSRIVE